jgi:mannose-6-phosphate isomerase
MANSDSVLRADLTPKHIDVAELLKHTIIEPIIPEVLLGKPITLHSPESEYRCPVSDFALNKIHWQGTKQYETVAATPEIILAVEGGFIIQDNTGKNKVKKQGEACFITPNTEYKINSSGSVQLIKAFVPVL